MADKSKRFPIQILFVSDGIVHPTLLCRVALRSALQGLNGYQFLRVASLQALPRLFSQPFEALVLYFHHRAISPAALSSLDDFVSRGGGVLAVHSALASFKQEARYEQILGGRFISHGPIQPYAVEPAEGPDEIFGKIPAFALKDELYRNTCAPDNRVHFWIPVDGKREPLVWTRHYGRGRVCCCAAGHTLSSLRQPAMREILRKGLAWVTTGRALQPI
jgi:type 1 glutamine amidotransferase